MVKNQQQQNQKTNNPEINPDQPLDLTVGNPAFAEPYWQLVDGFYGQVGQLKVKTHQHLSYDYAQTAEDIKTAIKNLHKSVGNAEVNNKDIVLGHGASQLISAAAYAAGLAGAEAFYAKPPYWPRIPTLLQSGWALVSPENTRKPFKFSSDNMSITHRNKNCLFITLPNNPDSSLKIPDADGTYKIYDLCYNWPQYGKIKKYNEDVMIFGVAKATGHAGTRLGWAIVKDQHVADKMRNYIELTTSGVSKEAQQRVISILNAIDHLQKDEFTSIFEYTKHELDKRWAELTVVTKLCDDFVVLNEGGMFAWCKWAEHGKNGSDMVLSKYNIQSVGGEAFGTTKEYFRLSLGCSQAQFNELIRRLNEC